MEMVGRDRGIRAKEGEPIGKLLTAYTRKAHESELGKLIVETAILLSARTQPDGGKVLRAAAHAYKVDTDAIALKVKQEFAVKEKAKTERKVKPKTATKTSRNLRNRTYSERACLRGRLAFSCRPSTQSD
jgi:ParB family chromosome partitioning protein